MKLKVSQNVKAHEVYTGLFEMILDGLLEPGTYLRERDVAEQFRVSRTPVREAVRQLARDGYVRVVPRVGAQVNDFSLQDVFEVYDVRACLEPFAARLAAERMTIAAAGELRQVRDVFKREKRSQLGSELFLQHMAADRRLHQLILELAGNQKITQVISNMTDISALANRRLVNNQRIRKSAEEHLQIIDALLRNDSAAAEVAMARHLLQAKEDMRDLILADLGPHRISLQVRQTGTGEKPSSRISGQSEH